MADHQDSNKELNQIPKPHKWHSILVGEDLMVTALQKSLHRQGFEIPREAACQATRDVIGELYALLKRRDLMDVATQVIQAIALNDDGSGGDGTKAQPEQNP